jgi:hypothetical protein
MPDEQQIKSRLRELAQESRRLRDDLKRADGRQDKTRALANDSAGTNRKSSRKKR